MNFWAAGVRAHLLLHTVVCVSSFRRWLRESGREFLQEGVGHLPPSEALMEIFRRAGVEGITGSDKVLETLPKAQRFIEKNCPPRLQ